MDHVITQSLYRDPSALWTLLRAFAARNSRFSGKDTVPRITIARRNVRIRPRHVRAFNAICGIPDSPELNILYPFTLAYPVIMRILCTREMPFSLFRVLNTANSITAYRSLHAGDAVDVRCFNSALRVTERGLETDITSEIALKGEAAWTNVTTYLLRGNFPGAVDDSAVCPLEPVPEAPVKAEWYLPARHRFRFGRVSGDTNGIHYWSWYARLFGFERDFSQPIRVTARCAAEMGLQAGEHPLKLDFFLKGPVYYDRHLTLRSIGTSDGERFDLYCQGNERPCISGKARTI